MNNVRVSVVIPTLNRARHLGEQLGALSSQDWDGDAQVVVAANGSTDEPCLVAREHSHHFPSFTIVDASDERG